MVTHSDCLFPWLASVLAFVPGGAQSRLVSYLSRHSISAASVASFECHSVASILIFCRVKSVSWRTAVVRVASLVAGSTDRCFGASEAKVNGSLNLLERCRGRTLKNVSSSGALYPSARKEAGTELRGEPLVARTGWWPLSAIINPYCSDPLDHLKLERSRELPFLHHAHAP
jgi:hypothetical protein